MVSGLALVAAGLVGVLPAAPASASDATTVWKLVVRHCTANEVAVGEACFDPAGHADGYNSVTSVSADGKTNGEHNSYEYHLPDVIGAGQANQVQLTANVDQITDGGAHSRICLNVYGLFDTQHESGEEPCATTEETENGASASASHNLTLIPSEGTTGEIRTLTIGFEEPGGYVNYDYKATNPKHTIHFSFGGDDHLTQQSRIDMDGTGSFKVFGSLGANMPSHDEAGTAVFKYTKSSDETRTAHMELVTATFTKAGHRASLYFRVTKSTLGCAKVGRQVHVKLADNQFAEFRLCSVDEVFDVQEDGSAVHVTVS